MIAQKKELLEFAKWYDEEISHHYNWRLSVLQLVNKYLKDLASKAGLPKKVSFHVSRHSFADYARKKTKDIYGLSKALGHSGIHITQQYLSDFDQDAVDQTMDDVFGE